MAQCRGEQELLISIHLGITDISQFKVSHLMSPALCLFPLTILQWAEAVQAHSAETARVAKRRLEEFIDMTSQLVPDLRL